MILISNDFWHKIKMYNFDPYSVLLSISTNIPVLLMTVFVLQGHMCERVSRSVVKNMFFSDFCFSCHTKLWFILVKYKSHGSLLVLFLVEKLLAFIVCLRAAWISFRTSCFVCFEGKQSCVAIDWVPAQCKGYLSKMTKWVSFNINLYPTHACVINLMHTNNHIWHR